MAKQNKTPEQLADEIIAIMTENKKDDLQF